MQVRVTLRPSWRVCVCVHTVNLQIKRNILCDPISPKLQLVKKYLNGFVLLTYKHKFKLIMLVNTSDCIKSPSHNILRHRNMHHSTFVSKTLSDCYHKTEICSYFHAISHIRKATMFLICGSWFDKELQCVYETYGEDQIQKTEGKQRVKRDWKKWWRRGRERWKTNKRVPREIVRIFHKTRQSYSGYVVLLYFRR
jgi:hypothetical protein